MYFIGGALYAGIKVGGRLEPKLKILELAGGGIIDPTPKTPPIIPAGFS